MAIDRFDPRTLTSSILTPGKIYETLDALVRQGNDGLTATAPHTCSVCGKVVTTRHSLRVHLQTFHVNSAIMRCDLCPKFYFNKHAIFRHMKNRHAEKKFKCKVCGHETSRKENLEKHMLVHGGKVECPICKIRVVSLEGHLKKHRPKLQCSVCQKMFAETSLKKHMKVHSRPHKCGNCMEVFIYREELRRYD